MELIAIQPRLIAASTGEGVRTSARTVVGVSATLLRQVTASILRHLGQGAAIPLRIVARIAGRALGVYCVARGAWWVYQAYGARKYSCFGFQTPVQALVGNLIRRTRVLREGGVDQTFNRARKLWSQWEHKPLTWDAETMAKAKANPHFVHNKTRSLAEVVMSSLTGDRGQYHIQCAHDQRGSSYPYDPVDATAETIPKEPGQILCFVDVDYYLDMNRYLKGEDALIYTFLPQDAAGTGSDGAWHYFDGNEVVYKSNSGFEARHGLWDYGADYVTAVGSTHTYTYRVTRLDMGKDRVLIYLSYCYTDWKLWYWLSKLGLQWSGRHYLARHRVNFGSATAFRSWDCAAGMVVSVANSGPNGTSILLSSAQFGVLCAMCRATGGKNLSLHNVYSVVPVKEQAAWNLCYLIPQLLDADLDVFQRGWRRDKPPEKQAPTKGQAKGPGGAKPPEKGEETKEPPPKTGPLQDKDPEEDCVCADHQPGIVHSGEQLLYIQDKKCKPLEGPRTGLKVVLPAPRSTIRAHPVGKETLATAIEMRVVKPQKEAKLRVKLSEKEREGLADRVHRLIFGELKFAPMSDDDEVLSRIRPAKRAEVGEGLLVDPCSCKDDMLTSKAFSKKEVYPDAKDPRVITPLHPVIQAWMYRYVYPLQDHLEGASWFAFGRPCVELARSIAEVSAYARSKGWVCFQTDFSRFDGTLTEETRDIEKRIYEKCFPEDKERLGVLLKHTHHVRYAGIPGRDSGWSRCSGAPDTCLMNSVQNIMTAFDSVGHYHARRYCFFGGDDGLIFAPERARGPIEFAAERHGFKLTCEMVKPGVPFKFLARYFNWGTPNSVADPARLIPKVTVIATDVPEHLEIPRLQMKVESLLQSDANTPIVGEYLKTLRQQCIQLQGDKPREVHVAASSWEMMKQKLGPWPNELESWMCDVVDAANVADLIASRACN